MVATRARWRVDGAVVSEDCETREERGEDAGVKSKVKGVLSSKGNTLADGDIGGEFAESVGNDCCCDSSVVSSLMFGSIPVGRP